MWKPRIALWLVLCLTSLDSSIAVAESIGDCIALEFFAAGCPQCKKMDASTAMALDRGWVVRRIDVQSDPYTAERWRIHSTPTTLLIRGGREVDRILGPVQYDELSRRMMAASSPDTLKEIPGSAPPNDGPRSGNTFSGMPTKNGLVPTAAELPSPELHPLQPVAKLSRTSPPFPNANAAEQSTVRIRIDEPQHQSVGTGTIIDAVNGEALVITCGHLFRGIGPNARISVEMYEQGGPVAFEAKLIDFEAAERDIGLIAFRPGRAVVPAPLIARNKQVREGDSVYSIGCDQGQDPSRRVSRITKLNRYLGAPNIEVAGKPVQGRSGGGLFNDAGELIGICYAADPELDEGLYCGTEVLYHQIAKLGLERLYQPNATLASVHNATSTSTPNSARNSNTQPSARSMTIIFREPNGGERQLQIQDPSPALLQAIASEGYAVAR